MNRIHFSTVLLMTAVLAAGCGGSGETASDTAATQTATETGRTTSPAPLQPSTDTGATGGTTSVLSNEDRDFVITAAQGGMAEVAMGQLATQKGTSPDVKGFGQRMVNDHGASNQELTQLVREKGLEMPGTPQEQSKDAASHLNALSGAEFDRMFMQHMVEDHQKHVNDFDRASRTAQDPAVKAWAAKTLPVLQQHLTLAREIQKKL